MLIPQTAILECHRLHVLLLLLYIIIIWETSQLHQRLLLETCDCSVIFSSRSYVHNNQHSPEMF